MSSATGRKSATTRRLNSSNSDSPTKYSKRIWRQPKTVREFAAQANAVATLVLNGQIDLDKAKTYAALSRVVAQTISTEVTRSRFLRQAPDLKIEGDVFEDE